ncbi:MAG: hypothetical protein M1372_02170 [Patescibacteria group bacterium]|nr:hypothetical protein [Patescibacteria group bacterium]
MATIILIFGVVIAFFSQNKYIIPIARWQAFINKTEAFIPYRLDRNPSTTPVAEVFQNPKAGTNCELLVQAIVRARGFTLPDGIRSSELYQDTEYTQLVDDVSQAQTGDMIGLCPVGKTDFKGVHVGIIWRDETGNIRIVHNARHAGFLQIQELKDVMKYPGHAKISWIKRPIRQNPAILNPDGLRQLGFEYLAR